MASVVGKAQRREQHQLDSIGSETERLMRAGLGPLEARVLRILWLRGTATMPELVTDVRVSGHDVAYTTVLTVVSRLHRRGILDRVAEGRSHRYRPLVSEAEYLTRASDAAVTGVLERFGPSALRHFALRIADLDPVSRRELIDLAEAQPEERRAQEREA